MTHKPQHEAGGEVPLALKLFSTGLSLLLVAHFSIIGFYQMPDNPLLHQYKYQMSRYIDPFFSQAWTLFSPNPINYNMNLLVQFSFENNGKVNTTDWIDVSEPIIKDRKSNFWSPGQRLSKYLSACMQGINDDSRQFLEVMKKDSLLSKKDSAYIQKLYDKSISATYGHRSIMQYVTFVANRYFSETNLASEKIYIRYRIFNSKFPRFSKRHLDYYNLKNYTFSEYTSSLFPIKKR